MVGALVAYLFDPQQGKGRRARFRDQTMAGLRDVRAAIRRRSEYEAGRIRGVVHEVIEPLTSDDREFDDVGLRQKIKSEILGRERLSDVEVDVENGTVTVTGSLEDAQSRRIAEQIAKIPGVESVDFRKLSVDG